MTTLRDRLAKIGAKIVGHTRSITFQMAEVMMPRGLFEKILSTIAAFRPLPTSIGTIAATSSCRRTTAPGGGCSDLKLGRGEVHRTAATLPGSLRSSRKLPGGQAMPIVHERP